MYGVKSNVRVDQVGGVLLGLERGVFGVDCSLPLVICSVIEHQLAGDAQEEGDQGQEDSQDQQREKGKRAKSVSIG